MSVIMLGRQFEIEKEVPLEVRAVFERAITTSNSLRWLWKDKTKTVEARRYK